MVPFYWSYAVFVILQELDIILRNRAPIVEKSIILMMRNTVNSTVKYIMLQF